MNCPSCQATIASSIRFCPRCGAMLDAQLSEGSARSSATAAAGTGSTQVLSAPEAVPASAPERSVTSPPRSEGSTSERGGGQARTAPTAPVPVVRDGSDRGGRSLGVDLEGLRTGLDAGAERLRAAAPETRLALVGAVIVVLAFLFLPYAAAGGTGAAIGGRIWWRPIAAVLATVLLAVALRRAGGGAAVEEPYPGERVTGGANAQGGSGTRTYRLLAVAVAVATLGATEAGLIGLVSGSDPRLRAGHYLMLLGSVTVAGAALVAATRRPAG